MGCIIDVFNSWEPPLVRSVSFEVFVQKVGQRKSVTFSAFYSEGDVNLRPQGL